MVLEGNMMDISAIRQTDNAKPSNYTGFIIQNYRGGNGVIYVLNNNGNTFKDILMLNPDVGARLDNSDDNLLSGIKMFDVEGLGISLEGNLVTNKTSDNNFIQNCEIHAKPPVQDNQGSGIVISSGSFNTISSNVVSIFQDNLLIGFVFLAGNQFFGAYNNIIEGNTLIGANHAGISLVKSWNNSFNNNNMKSNVIGVNFFYCQSPADSFHGNDTTGNTISYSLDANNSCSNDVSNFLIPMNNNKY